MMVVHFAVLYIQACVLFGYTARHAHPAKKQINRLFFALQELGDMNLCCFLEFYFGTYIGNYTKLKSRTWGKFSV